MCQPSPSDCWLTCLQEQYIQNLSFVLSSCSIPCLKMKLMNIKKSIVKYRKAVEVIESSEVIEP